MPKVSVIIPCYNQGQYIDEAVDSVLSQTFQDFEIIIVNDGSSDSYTNQLLESYNKPKTKVITTKNCGVSSARNTAIKNSSGEYILPLDADDRIDKSYLEKAVRILEETGNVKIVYCNIMLFGKKQGIYDLPVFNIKTFLIENSIHVSGLFRIVDFMKINGYDENMKDGLEDWEFWISLLKTGSEVYKINEPLLYYRQYETSRQSILDRNKQRNEEIREYICNKHSSFYTQIFGSTIVLATENANLTRNFKAFQNSKPYKLGRFLLSPFKSLYYTYKKRITFKISL